MFYRFVLIPRDLLPGIDQFHIAARNLFCGFGAFSPFC